MTERAIPPGAICLDSPAMKRKFCRGNTWLWDRVKNDPDFPKPIYIGTRAIWIEQEADAYLQLQRERGAPQAA